MSLPRTIFFGTPDFAVPTLHALRTAGYPIIGVVTQPDQPVGRKKILTSPPVKSVAQTYGIPVFQPATLKDDTFFTTYTNLDPELCIVVAYGNLSPKRYLDVPRYGYVNIHPSLLPRYRGPSPVQAAIRNGDRETGVSIMLLDEQMDHGPVLAMQSYPIDPDAYYVDIKKELADMGAELLIRTLPQWISGSLTPQPQDDTQATRCHLLTRQDGRIAWNAPADVIYNHIRALSSDPGTWTTWRGAPIVIHRAHPTDIPSAETPGTIVLHDQFVDVATTTCYLRLTHLQPSGGTLMDATAFARGHRELIGSVLE